MKSFVQHLQEGTVKTSKYSWGTMKHVEHGHDFSIPLHPEHHQAIHKLKDGESHSFTDETKAKWKATREGDKVHFHGQGAGNKGYKTTVKHEQMKEEVEHVEEAKDTVERDAKGNIKSWSHEGDWHRAGPAVVTDKSGGKHTPTSMVRHLARQALKKSMKKEEVEQIDELQKSTLASYAKKSAAELPKHQTNATLKHTGPLANAHSGKHPKTGESPVQWDDRKVKNRGAGIARAVDKLAKEEVEIQESSDAHRVMVTVSDPHHTMVTKRKEQIMKHVIVRAGDKGDAQAKAESFYKKKGYKVHGSEYHSKQPATSMKTEEASLEEAVSSDSKARYEYDNGKKPSGNGQWMFSTVHPKQHDVEKHKDQTHTVSGNFSDASKAAAKHFKEKGHKGEIHVLS